MVQSQFFDGLGIWQTDVSGSGAYVRLSARFVRSVGGSVRLRAGASEDDHAAIYAYLRNPIIGKVGIEFAFTYLTAPKYLVVQVAHYLATAVVTYAIRFDFEGAQLSYLNAAGGYALFATQQLSPREAGEWQLVKLVCDLPNDRYFRLRVNEQEHDLADYSAQAGAGSVPEAVKVSVQAISGGVLPADFFVDDILVTGNEV